MCWRGSPTSSIGVHRVLHRPSCSTRPSGPSLHAPRHSIASSMPSPTKAVSAHGATNGMRRLRRTWVHRRSALIERAAARFYTSVPTPRTSTAWCAANRQRRGSRRSPGKGDRSRHARQSGRRRHRRGRVLSWRRWCARPGRKQGSRPMSPREQRPPVRCASAGRSQDGLQREVIFAHDLWLRADFVPSNPRWRSGRASAGFAFRGRRAHRQRSRARCASPQTREPRHS